MKIELILILSLCLFGMIACDNDGSETKPSKPKVPVNKVKIPLFSGENAYDYVKQQVDFGPRVPNSKAHKECAAWFVSEFKAHGHTVIEQKFKANGYTGEVYDCNNIIAQYKPKNPTRILFAAHWDSRFHADKDTKNKNAPIDGADDGASGVGVILELSRLLKEHPIDIGVDFILFDAEDQGNDSSENADHSETWCLGSQYWAKNLHRPGYMPRYSILLDMVGGNEAKFYKEGISVTYAKETVNKIWNLANAMGYGDLFINQNAGPVLDDNYFVTRDAGIPMIDIIATPGDGQKRFPSYHHTHADNISNIDKNTLKKVGRVVTAFLYKVNNQEI